MKALLMLAKIAFRVCLVCLNTEYLPSISRQRCHRLYIMTAFLFLMHGVQMAIFLGAFGDKLKLGTWEKYSILAFGIFALLDIRQKHMMGPAPEPENPEDQTAENSDKK